MQPKDYLFDSNGKLCFLKIHRNKLPLGNQGMYLLGALFLQHYYSVFNFDMDTVGLGINKHSEGKVKLYRKN